MNDKTALKNANDNVNIFIDLITEALKKEHDKSSKDFERLKAYDDVLKEVYKTLLDYGIVE